MLIFVVLGPFSIIFDRIKVKKFFENSVPFAFISQMLFGCYFTIGKSHHQISKRSEFSSSNYTKSISHKKYHLVSSHDKISQRFWQLWWRFWPGSWRVRVEIFAPLNSTRQIELNRYLDQHTTIVNHPVQNACKRIGKTT